MEAPDVNASFPRVLIDGVEVPAALVAHFLDEAAAEDVDITDFTAALAPGQGSGLLPWAQANEVSFEALVKAISGELRAAIGGSRPGGLIA